MSNENEYNNYLKKVKVPYLDEYYTKEETEGLLEDKQNTLIAGANIDIDNTNTISVTGITEPVANDFDIKDLADSTGLRAEWSGKQDALTAGANIEIDSGNTISVTGITEIDDTVIESNKTWSSSKISYELAHLGFNIEMVQTLPASGDTHTIYLVPIEESGLTIYCEEYMYIDNSWVLVGNTQVDLSNYYTKNEVNNLLSNKQDVLTAGANIEITSAGTISATDTTYIASDFDIKDLTDSTGLRDEWSGKQDALTAGANIEIDSGNTINSVTYVVNLESSSTVYSTSIEPNKMYMFGVKETLTITDLISGRTDIVNEYMFQFTSGSTATTLNVPASVVWLKDPDIQPNKKYAVSIENNLGIIGEWSNE